MPKPKPRPLKWTGERWTTAAHMGRSVKLEPVLWLTRNDCVTCWPEYKPIRVSVTVEEIVAKRKARKR